MGLNEQFTNTRGQILLMIPLPDSSQAYAMLLQDENQRHSVNSLTMWIETTSMNARFNSTVHKSKQYQNRKDNKKVNDVVCDYCNLSGHTREKCFALHGYPEWHRLYGQPKPTPQPGNNKKSAALVTTSVNALIEESKSFNTQSCSDDLSEAQCHQLIQMIQAKAPLLHGSIIVLIMLLVNHFILTQSYLHPLFNF